jgi:p-hydroxybenzoate 3-monooxygenase
MATQMKTQVAIMGAGPSGLLLAHLLQRSGIDSIVIDGKSREEIEGTVKAGIVEQPAAEVLVGSGASSRAMNKEYEHHGIIFDFDGGSHRFDFTALVNKSVFLFPQHLHYHHHHPNHPK